MKQVHNYLLCYLVAGAIVIFQMIVKGFLIKESINILLRHLYSLYLESSFTRQVLLFYVSVN